jgi:hypothetical protein
MMDDDKQKRPLDPSDFEDDLYDDEFAFDEHDPDMGLPAGDLGPDAAGAGLDDPQLGGEFEDTPENWGDFEDPAITAMKPGKAPDLDAGGRKKSFLMKNFNTIVILAGVLLGIAVVGPKMLTTAPDTSSDMPGAGMAPDGSTAEAPPQPSPIAPVAPEDAGQNTGQTAQADREKLTPMPEASAPPPAAPPGLPPLDPGPDLGLDNVGVKEGPQDGAAPAALQTAQLEDPTPPAPIEGATDVNKPAVELPDPIAFENQPIPTASAPVKAATPADPPQMAASMDAPPPAETAETDEAAPPPDEPAAEAPVPAPAPALAETSPPALAPTPAPAPAAIPTPAPAGDTAIEKAELDKLNADNETLNARNKDLESEISSANSKIENLSAMLAEMEKKIAALEKAPAEKAAKPETGAPVESPAEEAPSAAEPPAEAPVEKAEADNILVPAKPTKRPETVPEMKKADTVKKPAPAAPRITSSEAEAPRWVLRSAQNGRAVVSDRSTGDLRSIQVGDTLRGVGRIESISNSSGRWVVQGSQGQVRQ